MYQYGHFSEDGSEFIITNPELPRPWSHFLTNSLYGCLITHTGGGYSFVYDDRTNRILRWNGWNFHLDRPGRYLYLRDAQTGECWSANYQPLRKSYDKYETTVGLGYLSIRQVYSNIESKITYFVPLEDTCEIWKVTLRNLTNTSRTLEIFPFVEWLIGDRNLDSLIRNIYILFNRIDFDEKFQTIIAKKRCVYQEGNFHQAFKDVLFFANSLPVLGYDCRKDSFLGRLNDERQPQAIFQGQLSNSICDGEEGVGVLHTRLSLKANEEKSFSVFLGQVPKQGDYLARILQKYRDIRLVEDELQKVVDFWQQAVGRLTLETPESKLNPIFNYWLKYQLFITNYWSRSPGMYHEGQGGRGYRDSCQDAEGILALNPEHTQKKILKIATLIRRDGTCAPGWSDTYGPYPEKPYKDHPVWLTSTVNAYVKETGDFSILEKEVSWLKDRWRDGGMKIDETWCGGAIEDGCGSLFEHLVAQLNFTFHDVGKHGLPRIGHADWNDAIDSAGLKGDGESVWLGQALVRSLKLGAELALATKNKLLQNDLLQKAQIITQRLNEVAWDGNWFVRGFKDNGQVFGSSKNEEGKIFLNTQSWAILSGTVSGERLTRLLDSVDKYLSTEHGLVLFWPHYQTFDNELGRIALFSPGTKENAAIFCHAATFMIAAYLKLGMANKALMEMKKIMPNLQNDYELYKTEPYVYAEYIVGPSHPYLYGEGAFTWVTGTASWTFLTLTELLFGVQRDFEGLRINPALPSYWKKARLVRRFRNATYEIIIENPEGVQKGVQEIWLDGEQLKVNLIPPHEDGRLHTVRVIMGKP